MQPVLPCQWHRKVRVTTPLRWDYRAVIKKQTKQLACLLKQVQDGLVVGKDDELGERLLRRDELVNHPLRRRLHLDNAQPTSHQTSHSTPAGMPQVVPLSQYPPVPTIALQNYVNRRKIGAGPRRKKIASAHKWYIGLGYRHRTKETTSTHILHTEQVYSTVNGSNMHQSTRVEESDSDWQAGPGTCRSRY